MTLSICYELLVGVRTVDCWEQFPVLARLHFLLRSVCQTLKTTSCTHVALCMNTPAGFFCVPVGQMYITIPMLVAVWWQKVSPCSMLGIQTIDCIYIFIYSQAFKFRDNIFMLCVFSRIQSKKSYTYKCNDFLSNQFHCMKSLEVNWCLSCII